MLIIGSEGYKYIVLCSEALVLGSRYVDRDDYKVRTGTDTAMVVTTGGCSRLFCKRKALGRCQGADPLS